MLQVTDFGTIWNDHFKKFWNDFEQSFETSRWKFLILRCAIVNQDYHSNYTFVFNWFERYAFRIFRVYSR